MKGYTEILVVNVTIFSFVTGVMGTSLDFSISKYLKCPTLVY